PTAVATLVVGAEGATAAVAAMSAALGSPHDVTGAAFLPGEGVLVRIEGFEASVAYRADRLEGLLAPHGPVRIETDPARAAAFWRRMADVAPFADRGGDVWRISVRPSEAPAIVARLACDYLLDWGGGLIWALLPEGEDVRARLGPIRGHATLIRASQDTRARIAPFHPEPPALARISADLKARFDPKGFLNPGLMG
ncbi:MAG: glycolate oxidase subunit GlcE, partial [Albidovulum sp.]